MLENENRIFESDNPSMASMVLNGTKDENKEERTLSELLKTVKKQKADLERLLDERTKK